MLEDPSSTAIEVAEQLGEQFHGSPPTTRQTKALLEELE
jgi:hypothetical protein